jgi:hypothetical protein
MIEIGHTYADLNDITMLEWQVPRLREKLTIETSLNQ